jgi:23S rRNA maturation-related 3'-5' exoribonuclease YhaM
MAEDHVTLRSIEKGMTFSGVYYLEQAYQKVAKNGNKYTDVTLRDKTGSVFSKFWGVLDDVKKGDFVDITATAEDYQGNISIVIRRIDKVEGEPENLSDLVAAVDTKSREINSQEFSAYVSEIMHFCEDKKDAEGNTVEVKDKTCALLVEDIFGKEDEPTEFMEKFTQGAGSATTHYGKVGGLLASTVNIASQARQASLQYVLSDLDQMILLTACLIHRVGAVDAYEIRDCIPAETKRGTLVGESGLTMMRFHAAMRRISSKHGDNVSSDTLMRIFHAVLSAGKLIKPSTKEALIIASARRTDTVIVDALDFIDQDPNDDEFTAFDPISKHRYYKGQAVVDSSED